MCVCLVVCDLETSKEGGLGSTWAVAPQKNEVFLTVVWHRAMYNNGSCHTCSSLKYFEYVSQLNLPTPKSPLVTGSEGKPDYSFVAAI